MTSNANQASPTNGNMVAYVLQGVLFVGVAATIIVKHTQYTDDRDVNVILFYGGWIIAVISLLFMFFSVWFVNHSNTGGKLFSYPMLVSVLLLIVSAILFKIHELQQEKEDVKVITNSSGIIVTLAYLALLIAVYKNTSGCSWKNGIPLVVYAIASVGVVLFAFMERNGIAIEAIYAGAALMVIPIGLFGIAQSCKESNLKNDEALQWTKNIFKDAFYDGDKLREYSGLSADIKKGLQFVDKALSGFLTKKEYLQWSEDRFSGQK